MHINVPKHVFHQQDGSAWVVVCEGSCGLTFYSGVSGCLALMAQSDVDL